MTTQPRHANGRFRAFTQAERTARHRSTWLIATAIVLCTIGVLICAGIFFDCILDWSAVIH